MATTTAERRRAVQDFKRTRIREAAAAVFAEDGLDGATIRGIAARAGYTPGAIYHHYAGKEEIYADLLGQSLTALYHAVRDAGDVDATDRARRAATAFFDYYHRHPDELDLGLYLYRGAAPRGLSPEIDRQLNGRLIRVLGVMATTLSDATGLPPDMANRRTVDLTAHMVGLLILESAGRLKVLGFGAGDLLADRLDELLAGTGTAATAQATA